MPKAIVLCMRWGTVFPSDYVNVLFHALKEHLSIPHDFVCMTDDAAGLHPDIVVKPIPDVGLPDEAWRSGAWPKITVLKPGLFPDGARVLFVDLDSMIVSSMDEFLSFESGFHAIGPLTWDMPEKRKPKIYFVLKAIINRLRGKHREPEFSGPKSEPQIVKDKEGRKVDPNSMGTGIFGFIAGEHSHVFEALVDDIPFALKTFTNEQHFIQHHLATWTPWRPKAVASFKYHLRRPVVVDLFLPPRKPSKESPILAFHGHPRPLDLVTRRVSRPEELPHVWFGPVGWFRDYWNANNKSQ